ncbi:hypothetical protein [Dehalobacter sp. 4CP]|uniref:hypothetical protein n=1 Tax=Dehalobacter sp. CP TaxID=2594474 RepID=UPI0039EB0270
MKRIIICCLLFLLCFSISACTPEISNTPNTKIEVTSENDFKIEGTNIDIGSSYKNIIEEMKEPNQKDYFEAGEYLDYGDITFFTDSEDEKIAKVSAIALHGERKIGSVKVGMLPSEVKQILGDPKFEGESNDREILGWNINYVIGNKEVSFISDTSDSVITTIFVKARL